MFWCFVVEMISKGKLPLKTNWIEMQSRNELKLQINKDRCSKKQPHQKFCPKISQLQRKKHSNLFIWIEIPKYI